MGSCWYSLQASLKEHTTLGVKETAFSLCTMNKTPGLLIVCFSRAEGYSILMKWYLKLFFFFLKKDISRQSNCLGKYPVENLSRTAPTDCYLCGNSQRENTFSVQPTGLRLLSVLVSSPADRHPIIQRFSWFPPIKEL